MPTISNDIAVSLDCEKSTLSKEQHLKILEQSRKIDELETYIDQAKILYEELEKQNVDLKKDIEWYQMWHEKFQGNIKKLQDELETYRPTKLTGNGFCSCFGCEQKNGFNSHWTDWCYRYKGHIYCYDCLQELLNKEKCICEKEKN